ncbi:MAG: hypothetical protein PF484_02295 [Bacteroidales bacterium]|jgi:hypothetical protein|nr:hypothetical protein [Bacteroidales bacterium]
MKKIIILLGSLFLFGACQYESIKLEDIPEPEPIDPTVDISFVNEIVPIFTDGDNCTVCHTTGKEAPDLTAANAYQNIISGGFVIANNAEGSKIYTYPNPTASTHVWKHYTSREAELLFTWINQGAQDN